MRIIFYLIVFVFTTSLYAQYDDVYYDPEYNATPSYASYDYQGNTNQTNSNYTDYYDEYYENTYVTNNYYYDDFSYSRSLRRYYRPVYGCNYYSNWYVSTHFYEPWNRWNAWSWYGWRNVHFYVYIGRPWYAYNHWYTAWNDPFGNWFNPWHVYSYPAYYGNYYGYNSFTCAPPPYYGWNDPYGYYNNGGGFFLSFQEENSSHSNPNGFVQYNTKEDLEVKHAQENKVKTVESTWQHEYSVTNPATKSEPQSSTFDGFYSTPGQPTSTTKSGQSYQQWNGSSSHTTKTPSYQGNNGYTYPSTPSQGTKNTYHSPNSGGVKTGTTPNAYHPKKTTTPSSNHNKSSNYSSPSNKSGSNQGGKSTNYNASKSSQNQVKTNKPPSSNSTNSSKSTGSNQSYGSGNNVQFKQGK